MMAGNVGEFLLMQLAFGFLVLMWYRLVFSGWTEKHTEGNIASGKWPEKCRKSGIAFYRSLGWGLLAIAAVLDPVVVALTFCPQALGIYK
jgi:hypothetical protein